MANAKRLRINERAAEKHNFAAGRVGAACKVVVVADKEAEAYFDCWTLTVTESCLQKRSMVRSPP